MTVASPTEVVGDAQLTRIFGTTMSPVARPVFSRRDRLRATWTTIDATELTRQEARVLDRRGQPLAIEAPVTAASSAARTAASVDIALAALAPGDYVLELVVAAGGTTSRRLVGFRVTQ
jgi:hypothetical protein